MYEVTDDIALTAVVGYRKVDTLFSFDVDGSPLALENTRNNTGEDYKSGEVRLAGKTGPLDWVGGVFFYRGDGHVHTTLVSPYLGLQRYQNHSYSPKSNAAFVNLTWHPLERLGVTLGGRLSDDKNVVHYSNLQDEVPANNVIFDVTPKDNRFDWKAGIDYKVLDETMVYASAATGFRLPSFNSRPYQPSQITQIPGDEILNYEIGSKSEFLDRRLRLNTTAFFTDYKTRPASIGGQEYQNGASGPIAGNSVTIPLVNGPPGSTTCRARTTAEINAGTPGFTCVSRTYYYNQPGRVRGVEAEVEALPVNRLSITGSFGYSTFDSHDINLATRGEQAPAGRAAVECQRRRAVRIARSATRGLDRAAHRLAIHWQHRVPDRFDHVEPVCVLGVQRAPHLQQQRARHRCIGGGHESVRQVLLPEHLRPAALRVSADQWATEQAT